MHWKVPAVNPIIHTEHVTLHHGDCLDVLRELPDASVDSVVTDPPYGLSDHAPAIVVKALMAWASGDRGHVPDGRGFMGRDWDKFVPPPAVFDEALRVLKPGGHLLCFAGSRTMDLMTTSIRFAGFEVRDSIAWIYGSGFPKSLDVSKAIDKAAGAEREDVYEDKPGVTDNTAYGSGLGVGLIERRPATPAAEQWQGWGTALKPAFEPVVVARKPLTGTVAANVLEHGTGALNIDACRIEGGERPHIVADYKPTENSAYEGRMDGSLQGGSRNAGSTTSGRWPANVVLDESQAAALDEQTGVSTSPSGPVKQGGMQGYDPSENAGVRARDGFGVGYGDSGGASRFFYVAKAPKKERPVVDGVAHPTVKPLALMRWLVRLVTPPGGTVLEPFAGSGTTVQACVEEGFRCIAIERSDEYLPLIAHRLGVELGCSCGPTCTGRCLL